MTATSEPVQGPPRWTAIFADARVGLWRALAMQVLGRRPADSLAIFVAVVAAGAILVNALVLQTGPHPAPLSPRPSRLLRADRRRARAVAASASRRDDGARKERRPAPRPKSSPRFKESLRAVAFMKAAPTASTAPRPMRRSATSSRSPRFKPSAEPNEALLRTILHSNVRAPAPATARPNDPIADLLAPSSR